jgi:hypothetical protein
MNGSSVRSFVGCLIGLWLATAVIGPTTGKCETRNGALVLNEVRKCAGYVFRSYSRYRQLGGAFEILRSGKRVYRQLGGNFAIAEQEKTNRLLMGTDITGDGQPNLAVVEFARGRHRIATVHGGDTEVRFDDLDRDGKAEAIVRDDTFAYWNAAYVGSPAPEVILRYKSGKYVPALDLMAQPLPPADSLARASKAGAAGLRKVGKYPSDDPCAEFPSLQLWGTMLDLVYTGHPKTARRFFDQSWPSDVPGKQRFLADFRKQLAKSPYWPAIKCVTAGSF